MSQQLDCLTGLKPNRKANRFCVFDIEARHWVEPFACGFFDGNDYFCFIGKDCIDRFVSSVTVSRYHGWHFYAHNGGRYDFNFVIDSLHRKGFKMNIIKNNSSILQVECRKGRMRWFFHDSFALLPSSLEKLTRSFNVRHQKLKMQDYDNIENSNWQEYLYNDVLGLYEVLESFGKIFDVWGVGMKMTISQQALATFRRRMNYSIPCYRDKEWFFRKGYYGGRTEVFTRYGENLFYYDFVSLYPSVMHDYEMPTGKPVFMKGKEFNDDDIGFFWAEVCTPRDCFIPVLPHRSDNGKLLFPVGKFRGVWDLDELRKAEEVGYSVKYKEGYVFGKRTMFREFIDEFYSIKERNRNDRALYMIAKLLMNSSYGKFGERREKEEIVIRPNNMENMKVINENLEMYAKPSRSFGKHILPAIAAHVTALARLRLYSAFEKCGLHNVYYCDTDSVITSRHLESSERLGQLRLEHKVVRAYMISPKFYFMKTNPHGDMVSVPNVIDEIIRIKGFNMQQYPESAFRKALRNDLSDFRYNHLSFGLLSENVRRFGRFVGMIEKKKSIKSLYDKRHVLPDFIHTAPIFLS